jgi:hypothetical protein
MTLEDINDVFCMLGLATDEQREQILSQGTVKISSLSSEDKIKFQIWTSNQTKTALKEEIANDSLE